MSRNRRSLVLILVSLSLGGCATPGTRSDALARQWGFDVATQSAAGYQLRLYRHGRPRADESLHVYLDGDGLPWRTRTRISSDPTPRRPLALELMALDAHPSVYLGRPCYFGQAQAPGCSPWMWTSGRYSERVIATLAAALNALMAEERIHELTLIGYSGGGVIAWLLAERLPEVRCLVTISANLNVAAWTRHHGYSPLHASLDPAQRAPLPARVRHWHLLARRDRQVPPELFGAGHRTDAHRGSELQRARIRVLAGDHSCCWHRHWSDLLHLTGCWPASICRSRPLSSRPMSTSSPACCS